MYDVSEALNGNKLLFTNKPCYCVFQALSSRCAPMIFFFGEADPEAVYNLFDFKYCVIKTML
jgi:hypothetical protein